MPELKDLILHGHYGSPNPGKVMVILKELELPYKVIEYDFQTIKQPPYTTTLNPNGRLPTLQDPNNGNITIWESSAIIKYLIDTYNNNNNNNNNKLTIPTFPEKYLVDQMLFFQATGQGPYYGQWVYFANYMPENKQAFRRYEEQTLRVWSVLDRLLEGKTYLVGEKCTYADLSFIITEDIIRNKYPQLGMNAHAKDYPNYDAWFHRLVARPAVAEVIRINKEHLASATAAVAAAK